MEKKYVKCAIEGLKSSSSTHVQETLLKIRSQIIVNGDGVKLFRECGGLECLLPHLRKPNERILDVTLSILGNCCLEEESSLTVGKLYPFAPLVNIIKTVCRDSIVGRACRLIGNLAQRTSNAEGLHNHGVVTALVALIENRDKNTSYPTLTMAVRAIRLLWMVTEKREEMLSLNAVRSIAILLTTECETAGLIKSAMNPHREPETFKKSQEELIVGILRCLGTFTTYSTTQCAEQIQGDGRGFQCLVALTKKYESFALKCLMNICYLSTCRPLLGIAGFVECLIGLLQNKDVSSWPEGAANSLAQLSGESVNRSRIRHSGGLPLLVAAAREHQHSLHALLQYVFDDSSFQIMVNEGLVTLLTDKLTAYLKTMKYEHNTEIDISELINATVEKAFETEKEFKVKAKKKPVEIPNTSNVEGKSSLFSRRKGPLSTNEDELKVVIERDNMIVGFTDAFDSDASDANSVSDDDTSPQRRKCLKRARSASPKAAKRKCQLIKMVSKDWSAGVYWEPKSPEWPSCPQPSGSRASMSPERGESLGTLSPYSRNSDSYQSGFSPGYSGASSSKRAKWDWSPESGVSSGEGSSMSPRWSEYPRSPGSPGSSGGHGSPYSEEDSSDSEVSGRYSPVCSDHDDQPVDLTDQPSTSTADLNTAQMAHDLDVLMMEDEESTDAPAKGAEGRSGPRVDDEDSDGVVMTTVNFEFLSFNYTAERPLNDKYASSLLAYWGNDTLEKEMNNKSRSHIACVLVLLFRVSHGVCNAFGALREEPVPNQTLELLTGEECLNALLDYVEKCQRPLGRAARILAKVLSNALCLISILKHRLVLRLHKMTITSKHPSYRCGQCKQLLRLSAKLLGKLTISAESSYGIGEISYQLLKGEPSIKHTLAITLPYIVRTERALKKYFLDCGAFNMLCDSISNSKENMQDCVTALSKLAQNAEIKDPKTLESRFRLQKGFDYNTILENLSDDEIVTFELDDLSTVKADRAFLSDNSEVFGAMLSGAFKESEQECVRLKNVNKPALEYLFYLLHMGFNNTKLDTIAFPIPHDLKTSLEVLILSDRFLLEKLKGCLSSAILQFQLAAHTADKIYVWSLSEGMGYLCVESVAYVLTGKMFEKERSNCFKSIMSSEFKEQWFEDIKTMIIRQLTPIPLKYDD